MVEVSTRSAFYGTRLCSAIRCGAPCFEEVPAGRSFVEMEETPDHFNDNWDWVNHSIRDCSGWPDMGESRNQRKGKRDSTTDGRHEVDSFVC